MSDKEKIIMVIETCILDLEYLKQSFDKGSNFYKNKNNAKVNRYRKMVNERLKTIEDMPNKFWYDVEVEE